MEGISLTEIPAWKLLPANPFQLIPVPHAPVEPCRRITNTQSAAKAHRAQSTCPALGMSVQGLGSFWHCQENVARDAPALLVFVAFSFPFKQSLSQPMSYLLLCISLPHPAKGE